VDLLFHSGYLARNVPDTRAIDDDPTDPIGTMFSSILAIFAEFEVDLLRARTKEGMAVARAKGTLRGRQPQLSAKQQHELRTMYTTGGYTVAEVFSVARATVYRTLRQQTENVLPCGW